MEVEWAIIGLEIQRGVRRVARERLKIVSKGVIARSSTVELHLSCGVERGGKEVVDGGSVGDRKTVKIGWRSIIFDWFNAR